MASQHYNGYKTAAEKGSIALLTDTIKCALLTSAYTPNIDTHVFFSDVSASESSGSGYTTGGVTMTTPTVTQDNTNDRGVFDADDVSWTSATIADARYALIYKSTGVASTSPLIGVVDLLTTQSSSGGTFSIVWNASGIFYLG